MSKCFIEGMGGGGGTKLFAAISATYPAGSTLTCTNGTRTFTARPENADNTEWVFAIPKPKTLPETWTVTATDKADSTQTNSQSVEITTEGQIVNVKLSFWNGELYKEGNEYTAITGGWTLNGYTHPSITLQSGTLSGDKMTFGGASGIYQVLGTERAISLTGINEIRIIGEVTSVFGSGSNAYGLALSALTTKAFSKIVAELAINKVGKFDSTLDVSGLDGDYYIVIRAEAAPGCAGNVTEVRLNEI